MSVNRETLKNFLKENGCLDPEGALAPLEKLFQIAETGEYLLASAEEIDQENLIKAVSLATGRPVSKVALVSLKDMNSFEFNLVDNFDASLMRIGNILKSNFRVRFESSFGVGFGTILMARLESNLMERIGDSLWSILFKGPVEDTSKFNCLMINLGTNIFYYLGFCILNDQQQIAKLRPLVELWSKCLILGFKQDEPETLLVICK
jgi:hypothetical protein